MSDPDYLLRKMNFGSLDGVESLASSLLTIVIVTVFSLALTCYLLLECVLKLCRVYFSRVTVVLLNGFVEDGMMLILMLFKSI